MLADMTARWRFLLVFVAACASGRVGDGPGNGRPDASNGSPDGRPPIDARMVDARTDAAIDAPPGGGGSGLDPELELPDPGGQACSMPGRSTGCPAGEVCRFFTSTEGRCEGCSTCGGIGSACTATDQCDILAVCYAGQCTGFCTLGTIECGAPADCINVGHATRGVCRL
jgi:hypothetical protein